jgi:site-specific recombinase XerD
MGIYKRGRTWWVRFSYNGRQIRTSTKTDNKKEAEDIYCLLRREIVEGRWIERLPGEKKRFREMMEKYMKEHSSRSKSPTSYRRDLSLAKHLNTFFGGEILTKITPKDIYKYKIKRREQGASPRTINYELSLMRHAFNLAIKEWEWLKENPVSKVSKEKVNNIKERWLTFEEEEKLLLASPKWLQELIVFSLETGLRQSELLNLQWSQIDLSRQTMTLLEQKNRAKDTLPLNKRAMGVLKEKAKIRYLRTPYVFCSNKGTKIDPRNLLRAFYQAVKKAGIEPLRWHDLRHTFATRLAQAGVDLYKIQKLGRWKEISMVSRYAHHYPESLRDGVEVLDQIREKISTNLAQSGNVDTQRIV